MSANRIRSILGLLIISMLALIVPPAAAAPLAQEPVSVSNEYIEVRINDWGQFTVGTVQGDPGTRDDDDAKLVYGHGNRSFTSFTSVRIIEGGAPRDIPLLRLNNPPQATNGGSTLRWEFGDLRVEQALAPVTNPYTDRPDTVRIQYTLSNAGTTPLQAGVRLMLDTMIGSNDYAPFFVPGTGNFDVEREYFAEEMPAYWKAFEAPDYHPDSLKGQGILTGFDATPPSRFVVASWRDIKETVWDYDITPDGTVGDSAVALYWEPQELGPDASITLTTYYGLAGVGGGSAWIDAPVNITSAEPEFVATLWVSNLSDEDFTGGEARVQLPAGLQLAPDEPEMRPMPTVPVNGGAQSVSWRLVGTGDIDTDYPYSATVTFETGSGPLAAENSVHYQFLAPPQQQPTDTPVPLPVAAPPPEAPQTRFPWPWLLLIPLLGLPLLLLLLRRQPARTATRVPPPRTPRSAPPPEFDRAKPGPAPTGADVTHGQKKSRGPNADGSGTSPWDAG